MYFILIKFTTKWKVPHENIFDAFTFGAPTAQSLLHVLWPCRRAKRNGFKAWTDYELCAISCEQWNTRCLSLGLNHSYFACRKTFGQELCVFPDRSTPKLSMLGKEAIPSAEKETEALVKLCHDFYATKIWPHFVVLSSVRFVAKIYCIFRNVYVLHRLQFAAQTSLRALNHPRNSFLACKRISKFDFMCARKKTGKKP